MSQLACNRRRKLLGARKLLGEAPGCDEAVPAATRPSPERALGTRTKLLVAAPSAERLLAERCSAPGASVRAGEGAWLEAWLAAESGAEIAVEARAERKALLLVTLSSAKESYASCSAPSLLADSPPPRVPRR